MWAGGLLLAIAGIALAGQNVPRTRYRPDPWRGAEVLVLLAAASAAVLARWSSEHELAIAYPALDVVPTVSLAVLGTVGLAIAAGLIAPPPRGSGA